MSWNSVKRRSSQAASIRARLASRSASSAAKARGRLLGLVEELLAVALRALDVVHHAVAAGEGVLQLGRRRAAADRACRRSPSKKACGVEKISSWPSKLAVGEDPFDHRLRRAAAVVADAVEAHGVAERRVGALDRDPHLPGQVGEVGDVAGDDAEGDDLAAADALPDEGVGGKRHLVLLRPAEDVGRCSRGRRGCRAGSRCGRSCRRCSRRSGVMPKRSRK